MELKADENKTYLFEEMPIPKAVLKLSIPTILGTLVMLLYSFADTLFVGLLDDPVETAAVTLVSPFILAFNAVNNLFGVGSSSMMSRALGVKDYDTVHKSSAFGFYCSAFFAVIYSLLSIVFKQPLLKLLGASAENNAATSAYMFWTVSCGAIPSILNVVLGYLVRSEGDATQASIGVMSGCILNIILDPLFIMPRFLNMGAAGAGCATFISNTAACIYFIVLILARGNRTHVSINPKDITFNKNVTFGVFKVGIPAAIQNLLNVTGMTILNNFVAVYSSAAIAAMGISYKVSMVPMFLCMGVSQGIQPLIGYNYSSKNYERMKKTAWFTLGVSLVLVIIVAAVFVIIPDKLVSIFLRDAEVVDLGSKFIKGFCLAQPFLVVDFLAVGIFQSCGMGGRALIFAVMRKIILEIPFMVLLNKLFPLYGLAYAQPSAEFVLAIIAFIVLINLFKKLKSNEI